MLHSRSGRLRFATALACLVPLLDISAVGAQSPSYLFSVSTRTSGNRPARFVSADVGYGERVFSALGVEHLEQRLGGQFALTQRFTLLAQAGFASQADANENAVALRSELLADVFSSTSPTVLAFGIGAAREYSRQALALGRIVLGYRTSRWDMMSNVRLERAMGQAATSTNGAPIERDGIDVITTAGVTRALTPALRVGLEAVGEDLEGLFDEEEAEGGAKLMVGPTVGYAPTGSRWKLLLGGGPVLRLSSSTTTSPVPTAVRDLTTKNAFLVRASLSYRW